MQKVDKRELILESIIKAYIEQNIPIGSSELGLRLNGGIPASTIRVYFKKLSSEGVLTQLHVSGGRVPTDVALQAYWIDKFSTLSPFAISLDALEQFQEFGIYTLVTRKNSLKLLEILNFEERFLILCLDGDEIVLSYSEPLFRFLHGFIGCDLLELRRIFLQVGLGSLCYKLDRVLDSRVVFGSSEMVLYEICKNDRASFEQILPVNFSTKLDNGLYFEELVGCGNMALKTDVIVNNEVASMFCVGKLNSNFEQFFDLLKEAV